MKLFSFLSVSTFLALAFIASQSIKQSSVEKPGIVSKAEWGGKEISKEIPKHEIKTITIHHAGVFVAEDRATDNYMRGLQRFSQEDKDWMDIPYHFCIDAKGKIYEARPLDYPGDTNTEYDPTGHALINVIGNFEEQEVTAPQLEAVAHLSAWLAQEYEVNVDSIASHKDYSDQTSCPGKNLYAYLESGKLIERIKSFFD